MKLYSTWYFEEEANNELSFKVIDSEVKRAESVTIISAYYSTKFIKRTLLKINKTKRKKCEIVLVFNGFSGQRLYDQLDELQTLKTDLIENGFSQINIFINRETTLFHTKLYLIKNDAGTIWFAGSANASMAAFESNEEILIESKQNIRNIKRYIDCVIEGSETIENVSVDEDTQTNLIGFFRTGSIYFKPSSQISFTFSDLKLPSEIEDTLSNISNRPRNTNPGKAWGAYNLKLSLGINTYDNEDDKQNLSIKPYSIETCFGYWVPNKYRKYVDLDIEKKAAKKTEELSPHIA